MPLAQSKGMFATLAALSVAVLLTACGSNPDTAPVSVAAIAINAPDGAVTVMGTMQFSATVTDANGNTIATTPSWTLVNGGGAITTAGLFTAGDSTGTFVNTIVATIGSVTATSSITVSAGALARIAIVPASDTIPVDGTKQFTATGFDAYDHPVDIPAGLVWTVNSPTAGTVDATGHFSAGSVAGTYTITATSGTVVEHGAILIVAGPLASIVVSPTPDTLDQGATQQFTAVGKDAHNNVVAITPVWLATLGGVMNPSGMFTAGTVAGTFTNAVTASSGAITGSATVTVNTGALASIVVTPANASTFFITPLQYVATGYDGNGNVAPVVSVVWSIAPASSAAGTISVTGLFTPSASYGTYANAIVATSGSISGTTGVTVYNPIPCPPFCGQPFPF